MPILGIREWCSHEDVPATCGCIYCGWHGEYHDAETYWRECLPTEQAWYEAGPRCWCGDWERRCLHVNAA